MFKNYFRTAWRNLLRNRSYSTINILGLAVGMAVALLIGLWVQYQYSYDRYLPGYQQVAQLHLAFTRNGEPNQMMATPLPLSKALREEVPGIKYAVHTDWMGGHGLVVGEKKIVKNGAQVEEDFFKIFPFPAIKGDVNKALQELYNIIITEATAKALFGNEDPMGRKVRVDNRQDLKVAAVLKDLPPNSTFSFGYVLPFSYYISTNDWAKSAMTNWDNNSFQTFVKLDPTISYAQLAPKIHDIIMKYDPEAWKVGKEDFFFHPMTDWHLYGDFKKGVVDGGFIDYVRLFSIIGILVLLIACVNFMNLSTARSEKRAREVGVRKVMGSLRYDLIVQFLMESMMITLAAAFISLVFVQMALPSFNTLTRSHIHIPWESTTFWGVMALYVLATGLLAGSRPAFYLSGFQPVKVLKGAINVGRNATLPRKILVVLQFTCSIALIIGTMLIYQQVQYAKDRPSGYESNKLVFTDGSDDVTKNYAALRSELLQSHLVDKVTRSSSPVTALWNWTLVQNWNGKGPDETLSLAAVDIGDEYFNTMGMQFAAGRGFTGNFAADTSTVIINEAAAKKMRLKDPVGQVVTWRLTPHTIVGVVKDALMSSPFRSAEPTFFGYSRDEANNVTYRLSATTEPHTAMGKIALIFNKYNPSYPFTYHFVDETYADKFQQEVLIGRLSGIFAALAIFISCLGLFGLAAYTAEQRIREIGIRKVLGASVAQLWMLLSKDFLLLVLISSVVASPVAYYFLQGWLEKYTYRITIGPGVFLMAGAMALLITVMTISFQAIRGAMANPTKSLRSE